MSLNADERDDRKPLLSGLKDTAIEACDVVLDPVLSLGERLCFFALGMGPVVAWNCVYVSENYFEETLGKQVLSRLGLCQNLSSLFTMTLLLFLRKQFTKFAVPVTACFLYMAVTCLVVLIAVITDKGIPDYGLYMLVIGNGLATGIAQTRLGVVAGLYGKAGQCGALLFAGNALGALLPPMLQTVWSISRGLNAKPSEVHFQIRQTAQAVFGFGLFGTLCAIVAMIQLSWTDNFIKLTSPCALNRTVNPDYMTLGQNQDIAKDRWSRNVVKVTELSIVITRGVMLYMLSVTPYIPSLVPKSDSAGMFWHTQLAALLITSVNVGDFFGRLFAINPKRIIVSLVGLLIFTAARLGFVAFTVVYIEHPLNEDNNYLILSLYFLMAATHGYLVVSLQSKAQSVCGFVPLEDACPVIAQMSWLASQLGLVVGISFSFIPL